VGSGKLAAVTFSIDDAIRSVRAAAADRGLDCAPVLIADRSNVVLRLDPHPIVARVAMATSMVRIGMEWLRREVDVARFLHQHGAAVTRPCEQIDPGPIERDGLVISFWQLETIEGTVDPSQAGARLASLHRQLRGFTAVPEWGGWEEARRVLARARSSPFLDRGSLLRLERAWEHGETIVLGARARTASFQAVHGDAHLGNVLSTARGAVWTDWEDAFAGPVEWDLAALRSRADLFGDDRDAIDSACAAYDAPYDRALLTDLTLCRNLQVIPWLAVFAERDPSLAPRMRARIDRLP
jgi:hypothetical protein